MGVKVCVGLGLNKLAMRRNLS